MTGKESQRQWARTRRARQFFAAASAGVLAACLAAGPLAAQTTQPALGNRYQAGPQTAPPRTAAAPGRGQSVVPANPVPHGDIAPKVTGNAPAKPALRPNPAQLQVMAVVNGEQITQTELGRECTWRFGKEVLEGLINRQLITAACQEKGIVITPQMQDAEIDRIAAKFSLPRDRWIQLLQEERGFSEAQYKKEIVWPMLALRALSADQTQVTQQDLQKAYESEFGRKVKALLIVHSSKQTADQIHAAVVANPQQFRDYSKKYSDDPGVASAYGVIPPIRMHLGDANLEKVAFSLQPGQVSPVIQVADKYYILKCEEQIAERTHTPEQLDAISTKLTERIKEGKLRTVAAGFFETMQKQAKIVNYFADAELAKQMPGVAATVNGRPITMQDLTNECLSRYGNEVLDGEISRKVLTQELAKKKLTITQQDIDAEVARAADMYGVLTPDGKPDVQRWLSQITEQDKAPVDLYIRDAVWPSVALKKIVGNQVAITEDDLQKAYEANYGERVEVLAIVCGDQRQAQRVWEMARNNPTDAFFGNLAEQYSVEPSSRANGGKVPPIQKHSGAPELEKEAFKLKAGELSGIVAVNNQFIVLRCLGRTQPVNVDPQVARKELTKDLEEKKLRAKMASEFDRLLQTAQVDNYVAGTSQSGKEPQTRFPGGPAGAASARSGSQAANGQPAPRTANGQVAPASGTLPRALGPAVKR